MKKVTIMRLMYSFVVLIFLTSCSSSTYLMTSEGESFDALSKITDGDKPCINPNGGDNNSNLVFSSLENDGSYNIYLKDNVLSKAIIKKTSGDNFNLSPNYCDSNKKIVFQYFDKTNFDIYYVDAFTGKAITQITYTDENEYNPSWSRDGKLVIFEKGAPPKLYINVTKNTAQAAQYSGMIVTKNQIWLKNIETGELKMLGEGSFPVISPDGKEIAFVKYDLNKKKTEETGTIWIMSIEGDSPKQLTDNQVGYATHPNWSPNGEKIVFHLTKNNKTDADIYSINTNGENLKQHTTNKSNDFSPYWSTDNFIYFSSDRGSKKGNYQIWRFKMRE